MPKEMDPCLIAILGSRCLDLKTFACHLLSVSVSKIEPTERVLLRVVTATYCTGEAESRG